MPLSKDGKTLFTPLSDMTVELNQKFCDIIKNKPIFCTNSRLLIKTGDYSDSQIFDYLDREELAVLNAVPTAEGAVEIAMRNYQKTINSSSCLVAGYGRIGRVLAKMLCGMGAKVYVSARRKDSLAWIRLGGYTPVEHSDIINSGEFDIIFNTVPALILDAHIMAKIAVRSLIIDLASQPGGVDFESAKRMGIKTVHALSLPGKTAPKTSGEIIKETIFNILEEEKF